MTASIAAPVAKASVNISPMTDSATLELTTQSRSGFSAQGLLIQLRAHHPTGCLLSELVQVYEGNYIVRAMVQIDGTTIATAMAAGMAIESAEDQARSRVLSVLGIAPLNLAYEPVTAVSSAVAISPSIRRSEEIAPLMVEPVLELAVEPTLELAVESVADDVVTVEPASAPTTSKARSKSSRAKAAPTAEIEAPILDAPILDVPPPPAFDPSIEAPTSVEITGGAEDDMELEMEYEFTMEDEETPEVPTTSPVAAKVEEPVIDLSDAIAQIGTEIDRIGWTKKQGSTYLQDAYGKRTRVELTEAEMMSFLQYLKSLPSKVQPALSELPF